MVSMFATGMSDTSNWDTGDAQSYYYNPNTSSVSFGYSMAGSATTDWNGTAVAFKAPAVGGGTKLCTMTLLGAGPC
jgi:hypothetical protein